MPSQSTWLSLTATTEALVNHFVPNSKSPNRIDPLKIFTLYIIVSTRYIRSPNHWRMCRDRCENHSHIRLLLKDSESIRLENSIRWYYKLISMNEWHLIASSRPIDRTKMRWTPKTDDKYHYAWHHWHNNLNV